MRTHNQLFIYFICLVSAMGGLLFGYDWVVIGGAKPFYEIYFDITGNAGMQALTMSIALLGCLLGSNDCRVLWQIVMGARGCLLFLRWCFSSLLGLRALLLPCSFSYRLVW